MQRVGDWISLAIRLWKTITSIKRPRVYCQTRRQRVVEIPSLAAGLRRLGTGKTCARIFSPMGACGAWEAAGDMDILIYN